MTSVGPAAALGSGGTGPPAVRMSGPSKLLSRAGAGVRRSSRSSTAGRRRRWGDREGGRRSGKGGKVSKGEPGRPARPGVPARAARLELAGQRRVPNVPPPLSLLSLDQFLERLAQQRRRLRADAVLLAVLRLLPTVTERRF